MPSSVENQVFSPRMSSNVSATVPALQNAARIESIAQAIAHEIYCEPFKEDPRSGEQRPGRRDVEIVLGIEQYAAPGRDVWREAEAEEGERRFGNDGGCDVDRAGHDDRAKRIGQDMAHDLAQFRRPERARRLDELL